ncbi:hypothetical protein WJX72_008642 [[Myrmecia] bisecta]|uniref:Uncharacterized protein n=1 Tax=[Myrmecia] bisecta TaxID=41462 RepID=A0AAW1R826_9CHLO
MLVGLPVVLPLLALYASRQREKGVLKAAVRAATKEAQATTSAVIATTVQDALLEMKAELQQAQSQQLQRQPQGSQLRSIEAKLAAMEGSVLSAGRSAQEAARQVDASGAKLARTTAAQLDSVLAALRREVRAELQTSSSDPASALARLEGRLASLEGSLNGMEMSQVEGMRRLTNSLTSAIADAEEALQATVRAETMRALEPVRRLPQMLATALPVTDITALQPIADGALPVMASLTPEERRALRELVAEETRKGSQRVVDAQVQALKRASAQPVLLADEQWAALGKRLASIERNMQHLSASQEEASSSSQGDMERLAEQLRGAKRDIVAVLEGLVPDGQLSEAVLDGLAGVQQSLQRLQAQVTATEQAIESSPARIDERGDLSRVLEPLQQSLEGIRADQAAGPPSSSQEAADEDSKEAAFKRMQALLAARNDLPSPQASPSQASDAFDRRSTNAQASTSGSTSSPTNQPNSNSQVPIDSWLDGPRRYEPHPLLDDQLHFSDPGGPRNATGRPAGPDVPAGYADQAAERQSDTPRWPGGSEYDGSSGGVDAYGRPILERPATPEPSASPPGYASTSPDADSSSNGTGQSASNGRDPWSSSQANSSGPGTSYDSDGRPPYYSGSERLSDRGNEIEQPGAYGDGQPMYYGDQPPADDRLYAAGQPDPRSDPYQSDGSQPCYMGEADALLREAVACFQEAAALKPASVKVLGNWGNALLAAGSNKKQFVDVLRSGPLPVAGEEEALGLADLRLVQEAEELLIQAGRRFLAVLQQQPDDPKALSNWAKALCVRAALATDPQTAAALYESAIAKFEACLEIDPDNVTALCACGFALRDLAQTQSKPRRVRELLEDARSYLQAAADRGPIDDTSIEQAIRQCDEDLEDLRAGASGR